jgi:hypothetical protein
MSDLKTLWSNQPLEKASIVTLQQLHERSERLRSRVFARNLLLYAYSALSIFLAGWFLLTGRFPLMKAPIALTIVAQLIVVWQISRRAALRTPTPVSSAQAALEFHRQQLMHQRAAVAQAWLWYMVPFLLPFIWELGIWWRRISTEHLPVRPLLIVLISCVFFWICVLLSFSRQELRYRRQLDELNRLASE